MPSILASIVRQLLSDCRWFNNSLEARSVDMFLYSPEYRNVARIFHDTLRNVTVTKIERVGSAHLYGMYLLKQAEYGDDVREMELWHATSEENYYNIIKTNLDWRRAGRVKFGQGVSFSPSAEYANQECNRRNPTERVCILCKVLVDKQVCGDSDTELPPEDADTTTGNDESVYVKYCDNEFYPEYAVFYESPPIEYRRRW